MPEPVMHRSFCDKEPGRGAQAHRRPEVSICDECVAFCNRFLRYVSKPRRWICGSLLAHPGIVERARGRFGIAGGR